MTLRLCPHINWEAPQKLRCFFGRKVALYSGERKMRTGLSNYAILQRDYCQHGVVTGGVCQNGDGKVSGVTL